ncbi:MAG TPA: hypothetical protein VKM55_16985 [Candidatus Lokiarchaeia archaeon]|nr:hypothetical protein [Candidatus Lokiarchaeia archaeon]
MMAIVKINAATITVSIRPVLSGAAGIVADISSDTKLSPTTLTALILK